MLTLLALLFEVLSIAENTGDAPPFPDLGKGGNSGGYTPVTSPENRTAGAVLVKGTPPYNGSAMHP